MNLIASRLPLLLGLLMGLTPHLVSGKDQPKPGVIEPDELKEFDALSERRQQLIREALKIAKHYPALRYQYGGDDPESGGFDCSGSVYYLLRQVGLQPARSSAAQYAWVKKLGTLKTPKKRPRNLSATFFDDLTPGDLLFWKGTYQPKENRPNPITHVQIYLGTLQATGKPLMVGASNGRPFQGKACYGYGVFDFRLPQKRARSEFAGYGSPWPPADTSKAL